MLEQLKELMVQYVDVDADSITPDARLIEDLGFNSYDFMSLLGELEDKFGITVDETEVVDIHTVQEVMDYIAKLQG
ncbi:MAG: acyl carrier protein [Huintestinicola sp.]